MRRNTCKSYTWKGLKCKVYKGLIYSNSKIWQQCGWHLRAYLKWNKADRKRQVLYDFIYMQGGKKKVTHRWDFKEMEVREDTGSCWRWELGSGLKGEEDPKIQASSFKTNRPLECNVHCAHDSYPCHCLVAKWCRALWDSMDCSLPGSSVHGISSARILEWVAISFSKGSSWPRNWTQVSCIGRWFCTTEPPRKSFVYLKVTKGVDVKSSSHKKKTHNYVN